MKYNQIYLIVVLAALILNSCGGAEENTDGNSNVEDQDTISSIEEVEEIDSASIAIEEGINKEIFLEDMPSKFLKLTEGSETGIDDAEEWVIYNWCFAELPQIWIEGEKGDDWVLTALYGQDSEQWYIKNFKAKQSEKELFLVVDGTFDLEPFSPNFGEAKSVNFWWNKDIGFASFDAIYGQETFFVPERDKDMYQELDEECEYDEY